jgi:hypothetical protein
LLFNKRIVDIEDYDTEILNIFSRTALQRIREGELGWESMVPDFVDQIIKDKCLFGYCGTTPPGTPMDRDQIAAAAARAIDRDTH